MLGDKGSNQSICLGMPDMTTLSFGNMCLKINGTEHRVQTNIILSNLVGEMISIFLMNQDGELLTVEPSLKTIAFSNEIRFTHKTDSWS